MRLLISTLGAVSACLAVSVVSGGATARADDSFAPPFVDHIAWQHWGDLSSLRVFPTPSGRAAAGTLGTTAQAAEAWAEVVAATPDGDQPGMRAQFLCHWRLAEFGRPGKVSWNLEPWRPVVDEARMLASGCNPGGTEEPF
jgi:Protein of unknown function (DUF2599)